MKRVEDPAAIRENEEQDMAGVYLHLP